MNWDNIIKGILAIITAVTLGFGIYSGIRLAKEEEKRIAAQNALAEQAEIVQEKEQLWSKLAQQREDVLDELRQRNGELADLIQSRDERILALTDTIANIRPTTIVIREDNINQGEEDGRTRVSFDQTDDPIRVAGYTLTNPPEAELELSFVRPLRLRTVVTQQESGQWVTYFESDWDKLEIQAMETIVNPLAPRVRHRHWWENIGIGTNISTSGFSGLTADLFITYSFDQFAVGPSLGFSISDDDSFGKVGLILQWNPFLEVR